ncbi:MAG: tRNA (adenosine(37)-N6)-threonylcarbamoyltransferase complex ATPase subunit type 1 TsaE [Lacunisphaera sp.]
MEPSSWLRTSAIDSGRASLRPSAEETRALATELAAALPADTILALHGDLGVGKTTFVQGLARGLGVKEQVTSPTFSIYSVYQGRKRKLVHLDAYRLEHERQIEALLLEEFLISPWCLAVEWPEKNRRVAAAHRVACDAVDRRGRPAPGGVEVAAVCDRR